VGSRGGDRESQVTGASAPPATRCIELIKWAEQANRIAVVERLLGEITAAG
jgi:hypothetical protein